MYATTKYIWEDWIDDRIDCSDAIAVVPAADAGAPITSSRDVEAKPSVDYG